MTPLQTQLTLQVQAQVTLQVQTQLTLQVQATHRIELDQLGHHGHAHQGDGLVHATRLSAHIALAGCRELSHVLQARPSKHKPQSGRGEVRCATRWCLVTSQYTYDASMAASCICLARPLLQEPLARRACPACHAVHGACARAAGSDRG